MEENLKKTYVKISLILIVLYTIVGFLLLPFLLKSYLGDITQKYLNAKASVKSIYFNPYTFEISVEDFVIYDKNDKILSEFALLDINFNTNGLLKSKLLFKNIYLKNLNLNVAIDKANIFNFDNISTHLAKQDDKLEKEVKEKTKSKTTIFIENFHLDDSTFTFADKQRKTTLKLKKINTQIKDAKFSDSSIIPFNFSYLTPTSGDMKGDGEIKLNPLIAKLNLKIDKMNLKPYNTYIQDYVNLDLNSGYLTSNTSIKITGEKIKAKGDTRLLEVDLSHSINKETLFKVKSLNFNKIKFTNNSLKMDSIVLDKSYINFAIDENSTTNLNDIVIAKNDNVSEDKNTSSDFEFLISKIEFKDGSMDFMDESLPIDFQTYINSLNGDILTISSNPKESLEVKVDGVVNKYGEARIRGDVVTINPKKSLNLVVDFKNIDVIKMSGYSGKFIGREIAKGKLWIALNYKIKDSQLLSTNIIKLKDLELGNCVESEDATSLPVGLAIALLKDNDGYIDIDMPVEGDVNNPDFKYGGAVWRAVGNLFTSIVTSPFKFLAKSLGMDGDELSIINFEYGSAKLRPIQNEKLDKLYELLKQRPELVLVIKPVISEDKDVFALKRQIFNKKILEKFSKKDDITDKYKFVSDIYLEKFSKKKQKEKYVKGVFDEKRFNRESLALISIEELDINAVNNLAFQRQNTIASHLKSLGLKAKQLSLKNLVTKFDTPEEGVDLVLVLDIKH